MNLKEEERIFRNRKDRNQENEKQKWKTKPEGDVILFEIYKLLSKL